MKKGQMSTRSAEYRQNAPIFAISDDDVMEIWPAGSWPGISRRRTDEEEVRELIDDLADRLEGEG